MGEGVRKNSKISRACWDFFQLIALYGFHVSMYSLNILLGYIENLKALKLDPKTLTIPTKKLCKGFHNLSITMASDVTHYL